MKTVPSNVSPLVLSNVSPFKSAFSILFVLAAFIVSTSAFAASPIVVNPEYSRPLLSPASQASTAWTNVIPNALADYFTYVPYSTADADALGFPAGVCGPGPAQQDCYTITAREVQQQLALPAIFAGSGQGLLNRSGVPFATNGVGTLTRGYGYGSGGTGWTPPGAAVAVTGNAPAAFPAGVWHFPAPTIKSTSNRPVRIQWLNELPGILPPVNLDPTIDCGMGATYCYPYNRMVTHVHGAHVGPESDGFANAWFTPNFTTTGQDFIDTSAAPYSYGPKNTGFYPNDQQAATIWYHDHAMGTTHQNTQMGLAGFWPITDDNERYLQGQTIPTQVFPNVTPTPNPGPKLLPYDPTSKYELGFALQDRTFYTDGQISMPDFPVYDLNTGLPGASPAIAFDPVTGAPVPCTLLANGLANPSTCKRLDWMYSADGTHLIPYVEGDPALANAKNTDAPFGAPSTTLEYFGNMPMVNGVTYGKYNVESTVYRLRFIGGADSRTWIMSLNTQVDNLGTNIPFFQIASEQGFLNAPVLRASMLLMPGERLDVLVDFTGLAPGTRIYMNNLGPDGPYQGEADPVRSVDIPVIMAFDVGAAPGSPSVAVLPAAIAATGAPLRPVPGPIAPLVQTAGTTVRKVSLMEITDQYGRTLPTIDSRGFMPMGVPITETMLLNDTETWDIINTTADAHPMHLHLVQFQVIGRTPFDNTSLPPVPTAFVPPVTDTVNGIYREPSYTATGPMVPPDKWDAGWKDTVYTPPGFVTTVRAKFDVLGTYVWHCHILSHEEHDMMRPQVVVNPYTTVTLGASATSQATTAGPITLTAAALAGGAGSTTLSVTTAPEYRFSTSPTSANNWTVVKDYSTNAAVNWPISSYATGIYDVKVDVRHVGVPHDSEVTSNIVAVTLAAPVGAAVIVSPANASTLAGASHAFTWTNSGANAYQLWVGTAPGTFNLGVFYTTGNTTTATGLPTSGSTIYVTLWSLVGTTWQSNAYTYTASGTLTAAAITSPANASTLAGASQTFTWANTGANAYQMWVGTTPGSPDIGVFYPSTGTTTTNATGLPTNGSTTYVTLWSLVGTTWLSNAYTYKAPGTPTAVVISLPTSGTVIAKANQAFTWSNAGANSYQVWVGSTPGGLDLGVFYPAAGTTTATVPSLPANTAINVTLWSLFGTTWVNTSSTYTSGP